MKNIISDCSREKIENFKLFLLEEIKNLLALVEHYKEVYKKMNEEISVVHDDAIRSSKSAVGKPVRKSKIPEIYPKNGNILPPKVKFIINEFGRGTTEEEIFERIRDYEGDRANVLKTFAGCFYNLHRRKKILKFHYKTSAIIMYGLLDWRDEITLKIKPEFHPSVEMITDIPADQVIPENLIIEK